MLNETENLVWNPAHLLQLADEDVRKKMLGHWRSTQSIFIQQHLSLQSTKPVISA